GPRGVGIGKGEDKGQRTKGRGQKAEDNSGPEASALPTGLPRPVPRGEAGSRPAGQGPRLVPQDGVSPRDEVSPRDSARFALSSALCLLPFGFALSTRLAVFPHGLAARRRPGYPVDATIVPPPGRTHAR